MSDLVLSEALLEAVKCGRYMNIKGKLMSLPEHELEKLLSLGYDEVCSMCRLSSGKVIQIKRPTALIVAIVKGFSELVEYLCSFRTALNVLCEVEDYSFKDSPRCRISALHVAAIEGKVNIVKILIESGASVNIQNSRGVTPLFEACAEAHPVVVEELFKYKADPEILNNYGISCLMVAAHSDHAEIIKCLLHNNVSKDKLDKDGRNVLFYTVCSGRLDTLVYLLDNNTKVVTDKHNVSILMEAVAHQQEEIVFYLIYHHKSLHIDLHQTDDVGRNVLFYLSHTVQLQVFDELIRHGVRLTPANDGRTLLMASCLHNNHKFTNHLLKQKSKLNIDINATDNKGRNVAFYCITGGEIRLFKRLLDQGMKVIITNEGITLLMQAVAKGRKDYIRYFLSTSKKPLVDIHSKDKDGWNAIFYAVASNNGDIIPILLEYGAVPEPAVDGRTIVMQAALKGSLDFVNEIIVLAQDFDVDLNERDNDGWSALWYTVPGSRIDVFDLLVSKGAKLCSAANGSTVLHEAVDKGKVDMITHLIENKESLELDISQQDNQGNSSAMYAAATGHKDVLKLLVECGVSIEPDTHGRSILMHACVNGSLETVSYLVQETDIRIDDLDKDGRNALFYSVDGGNAKVVEYLINAGLNPLVDSNGRTLLMQAASVGQKEICIYLLNNKETTETDVNQMDANGENALFYASRGQKWQIVQLLLDQGIEFKNNKYGISGMSRCVQENNETAFQEICQNDTKYMFDANRKDNKGMTIFHHCIMRNDIDLLQKLSPEFNSETDTDMHGITSSMRACYVSNPQILPFLVSKLKVDISLKDDFNRDTLFHAVLAGNINAVEYLLNFLKQHTRDINGRNALMIAAKEGYTQISELLIRSCLGRDFLQGKDKNFQTAVHLAALHGKLGVLTILERYGAELDSQDINGATPLMYASLAGHVNTVQFLLRKSISLQTQNYRGENCLHYCFHNYPNTRCMKMLVKSGVSLNHQDNCGVTPLMILCKKWSNTHIGSIKYLLEQGADIILQDKKGKDAMDYCPANAEYVKQMIRQSSTVSVKEQEALNEFRSLIPSDTDFTKLLTALQKEQILTSTLYCEIIKEAQQDRVDKFLDVLETRGKRAFSVFCKVLKQNGYAELAYHLSKTAFVKSVEVYV